MKDKRADSVVCATDAGREGELIFRLVYQYAKCKKPMERLWISSMEDVAILDGFEHLRPGSSYDNLFDAAVCRAGADWLVGINATRLFSVLYGAVKGRRNRKKLRQSAVPVTGRRQRFFPWRNRSKRYSLPAFMT